MRRRSRADGSLDLAARAAAGGDREAFAELCIALQSDVWRYCRVVTGSAEQADDAAQETLARAVTAIRRYRGDAPVRAWICVIARRVCWEQARRLAALLLPTDVSTVEPVARDTPAADVDAFALLDELDGDTRQAFVLTQLLGLRYDEAAAVCDCPVGTIRSRVHRARAALATAWTDRSSERPRPGRTATDARGEE